MEVTAIVFFMVCEFFGGPAGLLAVLIGAAVFGLGWLRKRVKDKRDR